MPNLKWPFEKVPIEFTEIGYYFSNFEIRIS